jgi:hypothetical protein
MFVGGREDKKACKSKTDKKWDPQYLKGFKM